MTSLPYNQSYQLSMNVSSNRAENVVEQLRKMSDVKIVVADGTQRDNVLIKCSMTEDLIFDIMMEVSWLVSDEFVYCKFSKNSSTLGSEAWVSRGLVVAHSKNGATELWEEFNKPSEDYRVSVAARKKVVRELSQRRQELRKNWGIKFAPDGGQITQWVSRF